MWDRCPLFQNRYNHFHNLHPRTIYENSTTKLIWFGVQGESPLDSFYFNLLMHGFNASGCSQTCRGSSFAYIVARSLLNVAAFVKMTGAGSHLGQYAHRHRRVSIRLGIPPVALWTRIYAGVGVPRTSNVSRIPENLGEIFRVAGHASPIYLSANSFLSADDYFVGKSTSFRSPSSTMSISKRRSFKPTIVTHENVATFFRTLYECTVADKRKFKNATLEILAIFLLKTFYLIHKVCIYLLCLLNINPFGEIILSFYSPSFRNSFAFVTVLRVS